MNIKFFNLLIVSLVSISILGQETGKEFILQKPQGKIQNSNYNNILVIDSRMDSSSMGIVQVGLMNRQAKVFLRLPLSLQLNNYLLSVIDSSCKKGTLVLQLRHVLFAEKTTMTSEHGYFIIRANLFAKTQNGYKKLASLDTSIVLSAMDVTNRLMKTASDIITNCILSNLTINPLQNEVFSYNNIIHYDSIEKRKIPIYNVHEYKDGLYYSYNSFKNQIPDKDVIVKKKRDESIKKIMVKDNNGVLVKLKSDDLYAFVFEKKPYIGTGYGYYPLYFNNDNFYFIGNVKPMTTDNSRVVAAGMMFGLIGAVIASNTKDPGENYFVIIDHITGGFVQIRKMPTTP